MENSVPRTNYPQERESGSVTTPLPLGYIALAFTTALIGCSFAHVLVPSARTGIGLAIGAMLLFGGIVQFLAGMWEYRRGNHLPGTVFAAYGGFLATFGVFLMPASGLASFFGLDSLAFNHALGLLFLCWLACVGVLLVASPRTHLLLTAVLAVLGLSYLFLTLGEFANANTPLLMIGGWLGIICALLAWYAALASLLSFAQSPFKIPMEQMA